MKLTVHTSKSYDILIEHGGLRKIGEYAKELFKPGSRVLLLGDTNVLPIYEEKVKNALLECGFIYSSFKLPAGERFKRLETIQYIYKNLAEREFTRSDFIVALGGGVTGDMAGFAAATYLRGIGIIQVPTSLLAQIDSSVGGKTGVDLPEGKNLVGAFYQPDLVLVDPETLSTLPPRFFSDGMGEAIKCGCIRSKELFNIIKNNRIQNRMDDIIFRCVDIKRNIVEHDEFDTGERMLLNFGHTFGHALEKLYNYGKYSHGEAVSIGMAMMARYGEAAGITKRGTTRQIVNVLKKYKLPFEDGIEVDKILEATILDKKGSGDTINLILLNQIGESCICPVPRNRLAELTRLAR